jgi:imidazolonepropionase
MAVLPSIKNAYLLIKDDLIADFGPMISVPSFTIDLTIDATGKMMLLLGATATHIVYAGNRALEFVDRINGLSYEEIKSRWRNIKFGQKLNESSEEEIYNQSKVRLEEVMLRYRCC